MPHNVCKIIKWNVPLMFASKGEKVFKTFKELDILNVHNLEM